MYLAGPLKCNLRMQVRSLEALVRQLECEAERNADIIREYLQQIDILQVRHCRGGLITSPWLWTDPGLQGIV